MRLEPRSLAVLLTLVLATSAATQWWGYASERRQGEQMAALAQPGDIRMLSSRTCVYCSAARRWMSEHRVRFDECFIERDPSCRALYDATLARGTPTLIVRGRLQVGFDAAGIIKVLEARRG
jgi:glutaredoxin